MTLVWKLKPPKMITIYGDGYVLNAFNQGGGGGNQTSMLHLMVLMWYHNQLASFYY